MTTRITTTATITSDVGDRLTGYCVRVSITPFGHVSLTNGTIAVAIHDGYFEVHDALADDDTVAVRVTTIEEALEIAERKLAARAAA